MAEREKKPAIGKSEVQSPKPEVGTKSKATAGKIVKKSGIGLPTSDIKKADIKNKSEIEHPTSEIKMEVHHHPEVEKKGLKEYLLEGLMIFVAVTMGFFAENLREDITKHEREHHLIEMLAQDLKADVNKMDETIKLANNKITYLDTLRWLTFAAADKQLTNEEYKKMYYIGRVFGSNRNEYIPVGRTMEQFEKGDAFALISKQSVSDSVQLYNENDKRILIQFEGFATRQDKAYEVSQRVFDIRLLNDYILKANAPKILTSARPFPLLTNDKGLLLQYASDLFSSRGFLYIYVGQLQLQNARAKKLIELIDKEYDLE